MSQMKQSLRGLSHESDDTIIQVSVSWVWCHSHPGVCLRSVMSLSSRGLSQECDVNVIQVFVSWVWCHLGVCLRSVMSLSSRYLSHEYDVTVIQMYVSWVWRHSHPGVCLRSVMSMSSRCHPGVCLMRMMSLSSRGLSHEFDITVIQGSVSWGWCQCHPGVCLNRMRQYMYHSLSVSDRSFTITGITSNTDAIILGSKYQQIELCLHHCVHWWSYLMKKNFNILFLLCYRQKFQKCNFMSDVQFCTQVWHVVHVWLGLWGIVTKSVLYCAKHV